MCVLQVPSDDINQKWHVRYGSSIVTPIIPVTPTHNNNQKGETCFIHFLKDTGHDHTHIFAMQTHDLHVAPHNPAPVIWTIRWECAQLYIYTHSSALKKNMLSHHHPSWGGYSAQASNNDSKSNNVIS